MEYSNNLALTLALVFAMAAAVLQVTAQESQSDYLDPQNVARREVGLADLTWDYEAEAYAQNYAEQRRGDCQLVHSQGSPYGENIYGGYIGVDVGGENWFAADAVKSWVDEKPNYDYDSNSCTAMCGHYTQVVWSATTSVGCARVVCDGNVGVFIICSYNPPGNYPDQRPYDKLAGRVDVVTGEA